MKKISSADNYLVKKAIRLKKSVFRRKQKEFLIDGQREIRVALDNHWSCSWFFYSPDFKSHSLDQNFSDVIKDNIVELPGPLFSKICYKENPDGFLAIFKQNHQKLKDIVLSSNPLCLILENVEKPGNLGAIIRTTAAVGVDVIIINEAQTDIYNPNVIRSSEGYVFAVPIVKASVVDTASWLKTNNIRSFGTLTTASKTYTTADFNGPTAIILGSEARGLSDKWVKTLDESIFIPMRSGLDSLNVSVAGAVVLYEVLRQRSAK